MSEFPHASNDFGDLLAVVVDERSLDSLFVFDGVERFRAC